MKVYKAIFSLSILAILLGISSYSKAQLYSPGRNWASLTQYINQSNKQDSIFVFFSSDESPKKGKLRAKFSNGALSNFVWYKYNDAIVNPANRFVEFFTENGVLESNLTNLDKGGYKVSITRIADGKIEMDTCWVMIDDVVITGINSSNTCDYLRIEAMVQPNRYAVIYDYFTYQDITKPNHPEINKIGSDYFKDLKWSTSNSQVTIPSTSSLSIIIQDPAPLYDSKYNIRIKNPFGREFTKETDLIKAKAAKADFSIFIDKKDAWIDGGAAPSGEAPLKMKFESKSINSDSIYWRVINDEELFQKGADSIIWRDSVLFSERIDAYPTPEKMIPGKYPIEHIAVNLNSGCRDTMKITVEVDTSGIKSDAIPNVFSPNGDGSNEYFKLKEVETNVQSIKSFHVFILSRGGSLVYEYSGNPKEWEGWNGKIEGNKGDAPEGVYFYIIEATGWDNKKFKRGPYKGFLHLFRGK